ncbi:hypothetical protein JXB41_09045 [Candidatus Woesearchaeota archaeon]|nr:hypothetical protein [Candidatus Woesearchaeota archaeon]
MINDNNKNISTKEVLQKISLIRKEITELRIKLNEIDDKKETAFEEKNVYSKDISSDLRKLKSLKHERDNLTREVKQLKQKREQLNSKVKESIEKIKGLNQDKFDLFKKYNIKVNPLKISEEIEKLEYKIETEALSFKNEKTVMKKINELKKKLKGSEEVTNIVNDSNRISNEIKNLKQEANSAHQEIQEKAKLSQKKHEEMILFSKQIDELKKKEKDAFKIFSDYKDEFNKINLQLKEKLVEMNKLSEKATKSKEAIKKAKKKRQELSLKEKSDEVKEKIKSRKKLTTEDILIFQRTFTKEKDMPDNKDSDKPIPEPESIAEDSSKTQNN